MLCVVRERSVVSAVCVRERSVVSAVCCQGEVCCECCVLSGRGLLCVLCVVRERSLRRADRSPEESY